MKLLIVCGLLVLREEIILDSICQSQTNNFKTENVTRLGEVLLGSCCDSIFLISNVNLQIVVILKSDKMSHFDFAIPLQKDELLESHAGQYHVEDVVQARVLLSKLQGNINLITSP